MAQQIFENRIEAKKTALSIKKLRDEDENFRKQKTQLLKEQYSIKLGLAE